MKKTVAGGEDRKVVKGLKLNRETVAALRTRTSLRTGLVNARPSEADKAICASTPLEQ